MLSSSGHQVCSLLCHWGGGCLLPSAQGCWAAVAAAGRMGCPGLEVPGSCVEASGRQSDQRGGKVATAEVTVGFPRTVLGSFNAGGTV